MNGRNQIRCKWKASSEREQNKKETNKGKKQDWKEYGRTKEEVREFRKDVKYSEQIACKRLGM